jgi:hypothetical protein
LHSAGIRELISANESFREMCDDLASAEDALAATDRLGADVRDRRRTEYEVLIEALAKEIEDALRQAKVIPITSEHKR